MEFKEVEKKGKAVDLKEKERKEGRKKMEGTVKEGKRSRGIC